MKWNWSNPAPTPDQIAAWADGELNRADAERVEAWLAAHPDAADESDPGRIVHLYRDHPPPEPSDRAWQSALNRIVDRASRPGGDLRRPGSSWRMRLFLGLVATAAVLGGVLLARAYRLERSQEPKGDFVNVPNSVPTPDGESDEPFPVVTFSEVDIISVNAEDADRVVMGQPLLGAFEVAGPNDIEIVNLEPDPDEGQMPQMHRGAVPMILVAADREEP